MLKSQQHMFNYIANTQKIFHLMLCIHINFCTIQQPQLGIVLYSFANRDTSTVRIYGDAHYGVWAHTCVYVCVCVWNTVSPSFVFLRPKHLHFQSSSFFPVAVGINKSNSLFINRVSQQLQLTAEICCHSLFSFAFSFALPVIPPPNLLVFRPSLIFTPYWNAALKFN